MGEPAAASRRGGLPAGAGQIRLWNHHGSARTSTGGRAWSCTRRPVRRLPRPLGYTSDRIRKTDIHGVVTNDLAKMANAIGSLGRRGLSYAEAAERPQFFVNRHDDVGDEVSTK
jgi:hypothetical protein